MDVFDLDIGQAVTLNKQIMAVVGWGGIQYFGATESSAAQSAIKMLSAVGAYTSALWLQGSDVPRMKAFEDAFMQRFGQLPSHYLSYFYNCFWTAIKAI